MMAMLEENLQRLRRLARDVTVEEDFESNSLVVRCKHCNQVLREISRAEVMFARPELLSEIAVDASRSHICNAKIARLAEAFRAAAAVGVSLQEAAGAFSMAVHGYRCARCGKIEPEDAACKRDGKLYCVECAEELDRLSSQKAGVRVIRFSGGKDA